MKKKIRIIIVIFSCSILLMSVLSIFYITRFTALIYYSTRADHSGYVLRQLHILESSVNNIGNIQQRYMITKDSACKKQLQEAKWNVQPQLDSLQLLITGDEQQYKDLVLLKSSLSLFIANVTDDFSYRDTINSPALNLYYIAGQQALRNCIVVLQNMQNRENKLWTGLQQNKVFYRENTSSAIKFILISFCCVTIILFILITRELTKRMSYQNELQAKIVDLERSHTELEQIAYAASHHLQEPLRKISIFTDRLLWLKDKDIDEESKLTLKRINENAAHMQELIEDLAQIAGLTAKQQEKETIDINKLLQEILTNLRPEIEASGAVIKTEQLPVIHGYPKQVTTLFVELLDNAIKFARPGVGPVINISADVVGDKELSENNKRKKYYRIEIADNGIGFDNKFSHKLFQMFQRLHDSQSEYVGKGVGLTMCQRIMANHNGFIQAFGHPQTGATFKLFFPVNE